MDGAAARLKLFKADLMVPGAFDEAIAGCDMVIHTASPYQLDVPKGEHSSRAALISYVSKVTMCVELCYAMVCCAVLCCAVLCCANLCCVF
jgi:hypothetical protein